MTLTPMDQKRLVDAMNAYDANVFYDQTFYEVNARLRSSGEAGKLDIAGITFWKRVRTGSWVKPLLRTPEKEVRAATSEAFGFASMRDDGAALGALAVLPGYGNHGALATALLCAWDQDHYAVMDVRAHRALELVGHGVTSRRAVPYLQRVRELRDDLRLHRPETTARDVDKALFIMGG